MATDIFGRTALAFGGAFSADGARIDFDLGGCLDEFNEPIDADGLLAQQLAVNYQQPITRLYEIGTNLVYYVAGRSAGQLSVDRVVGPGVLIAEIYSCIGDVCNALDNDCCICLQPNCNADDLDSGLQISLKNIVLQAIGFSVAAADMIINEQLSIMFVTMLLDEGECTGSFADVEGCQFE